MARIYNKLTVGKPNYLDIFFFFIVVVVCYFCFNHGDILHTGGSSFTYLNGHFRDFYEVNKKLIGGDNYLPSTYILFAIWNIPIRLLGLVKEATMNVGYIIFWYKLLPVLFSVASAFIMYKLGRLMGLSTGTSKLMTIVWISSPILVFSQFIFGQYDIFTVFFVLIGIYYFLKRNMLLFILFFGISFTFKYFSVFIFLPLLLWAEKNPFKLIGYLVFAVLPLVLEIWPYLGQSVFNSDVMNFGNAMPRPFQMNIGVYPTVCIFVFLLCWFVLCGICYFGSRPEDRNKFTTQTWYISLVAASLVFSLMLWHPQWVLFLTPFLAVTTFMNRKAKYLILFDFLLMFAFVGFTVCFYQWNVDQQMMMNGVLARFNPQFGDPEKTMRMANIYNFGLTQLDIKNVYFTFFVAILALNLIFKYPSKENIWQGEQWIVPVKEYWNYARLRFFGGIGLFVVPAFISFLVAFSIITGPKLISPVGDVNVPGNVITFRWQPCPNATNYLLDISDNPAFRDPLFFRGWAGNATSKTVSGFPSNGTRYYWRIVLATDLATSSFTDANKKHGEFINGPPVVP